MPSLDHKRRRIQADNTCIAVIQEFINSTPIATTIIQNSAFSRHMILEDINIQGMCESLLTGH